MEKREFGIVKMYEEKKGWGFIGRENGADDIFFHFSGIRGTGYKKATVGERVSFVADKNDRGLIARDIAHEN